MHLEKKIWLKVHVQFWGKFGEDEKENSKTNYFVVEMSKKDTRDNDSSGFRKSMKGKKFTSTKMKIWLELDKENDQWQPINKMCIIKDKKDII